MSQGSGMTLLGEQIVKQKAVAGISSGLSLVGANALRDRDILCRRLIKNGAYNPRSVTQTV